MGPAQLWNLPQGNDHSDKSNLKTAGGEDALATLLTWVEQNPVLSLTIGSLLILLVLALALLFSWLSSRGRLMLLDGVVHNRGAILAPWKEYRREANSLFRGRLVLGLISFAVLIVLLLGVGFIGFAGLPAIPFQAMSFQGGLWHQRVNAVVITSLVLVLIWVLINTVIDVLLLDLVCQ